jgi:sulfite exporter TauE/SafE
MRFPILRIIVAVQALCGLAFVLGAVYLMSMSLGADVGAPELRTLFATTPIAEIAGITVSVLMLIIGLSAIAFGELIEVVLEIEKNTRKAKDKAQEKAG